MGKSGGLSVRDPQGEPQLCDWAACDWGRPLHLPQPQSLHTEESSRIVGLSGTVVQDSS